MSKAEEQLTQARDRTKVALTPYLKALSANDLSWGEALTRLLTDLHHFCARSGLSFDRANSAAQERFTVDKDAYLAERKAGSIAGP